MSRHPQRWLLVVLLLGVALRLGYAADAAGLFHPDDIFQSLEPAHGVLYGTGFKAEEFQRGARSWTVPGVYLGLLGALKLVGVTGSETYMLVVRLLTALLAATWILLCFRIGRALHSSRAGLYAAWMCATYYLLVLVAPRALSHTFSITFALWATARVVEQPPGAAPAPRRDLATGLLLGLAFACRYQDGLAAAGLAGFLALERRRGTIPYLVLGSFGAVVPLALLDWALWGVPLHSLLDYFRLNVAEARAKVMAVKPWHFYATQLPDAVGAGLVVLGLMAVAGGRALRLAALVPGLVVLAHSFIDQKETRLILLALVVALPVAGVGLAAVTERLEAAGRPRLALGLLAAALLVWGAGSAARAATVSFAALGSYSGLPEEAASPWTFRRDLNRALARAGRRPDLCAAAVLPYGRHAGSGRLVSTGGYTYFHRDAPLDSWGPTTSASPLFNYVVACAGPDGRAPVLAGTEMIERVGACVILRRATGTDCAPAAVAPLRRDYAW